MNHHLVVSQQSFTDPSTTSPSPSVIPPSIIPPSPTIHLKNVSSWNVDTLKKLHLTLFPVHYSDSFYEQVQNVGEFAKVAYLDSIPVGAICCRIEPELQQEGKYRVYIMTLGVLEPYRRRRLGHLMLQHIVDQAQLQPTITRIYLHVQVLNTTALSFYHCHGFQKVALARDYYKNIHDKDAYVVVKNITHGAPSSSSSSSNTDY
ncbi:acyl-CoA N-acyltransferase [Absidia repens]|uniref:Acyl-CoA N-acyltransferase n=1 Tax=Absidia repens TaxID=90262 RepID=A0A1X2IFI6_9FUNG|nr:acyl-CoA N-acyltransferase [Absidia repens]